MRIVASAVFLLIAAVLVAEPALRPLWTRTATPQPLTAWYLCGPFFPDRPALDLERAHARLWGLTGVGRPLDGAVELRADGALLTWTAATLLEDVTPPPPLDFDAVLGTRLPARAVVYAYAVVPRAEAGNACLALDRAAGIAVWVNGDPVLTDRSPRLPGGNPILPVAFRRGDNIVFVRLEPPANNHRFTLGLLPSEELRVLASARPPRDFTAGIEASGDTLTVRTGDVLTAEGELRRTVVVSITGAGGEAVAEQLIAYGETASFNTATWPDGGYDVTCRLQLPPDTPGLADYVAPALAHFLWYRGDALVAARALVDSAPDPVGDDARDLVHDLLAGWVRERIGPDLANLGGLPSVIAPLMEWQEAQQPAGDRQPASRFFVRLAYRDEIDGSPQFARLYLPPNYTPARRYPLIVSLHGMNRANPPYTEWGGLGQRYDTLADRSGAVVLYPFGRANAWYRGLGERDVLRCLAMAKARCSIDPDRVYLIGYSMGGAGVWHVGSAHPELFAALAPWYGGLEPGVTTPRDVLAGYSPRQQRYAARWSSFAQVESLLTTPVFVSHGDRDGTVPIEITRYGVNLLHSWRYPVYLWEQPGGGHGGIDTEDKVIPWLFAQRRVAHPIRVRLRSASLAGAAAHWVRVLQREKPEAFVQADAQVIAANVIRLDTDNALAVRLDAGQAPIDAGQPVRVIWNGREDTVPVRDGAIVLHAPDYVPVPGEKSPALDGPLGDLFNTPFMIVIGTASPDPAMRAFCERYARRQVAWWKAFQQTIPRLVLDSRLTEEDCARYSLLLVGGPGENQVTRRLAAGIPLAITPEGFSIDGRAFAVRDGGVRLIYPHPLNPERYVAIAAANSADGMYRLAPFINRCDVDYAVTDGRPGLERAAGLFDRNWRLDERLLECAMSKGPLPGVPKILSAIMPARRLYLASLAETQVEGDVDYLPGTVNTPLRAVKLGRKTFPRTLCMGYMNNARAAFDYNLYGGEWRQFRAALGIAGAPPGGRVVFVVRGDGRELYRSPAVIAGTSPLRIEVPIRDVAILRLEMEFTGYLGAGAACWGDARVEK